MLGARLTEILTPGIKVPAYENTHCSFICYSKRLETTEKSAPGTLVKLRT